MSPNLYRLVYYSRNRVPGGAAELSVTIRAILTKSQLNNQRVGVTGALMFNAGCFAQVLEGDREAIEEVFERIQQDHRHGDVSLLHFSQAPYRAFENWSMAYVGASLENASRFTSIACDSGYDPSRMTGDALFEILRRLAFEEEAA